MRLLITGAAGFIGSCLVKNFLNKNHEIFALDREGKFPCSYLKAQNNLKTNFLNDSQVFSEKFDAIIHMGAITDTGETDWNELVKYNIDFSTKLWNLALQQKIPYIYASSAATYGDGENGFSDDHQGIEKLEPLNLYGKSKHEFDLFALKQNKIPPAWYGLKFFNVYGPNEYHKARMASVVFHGFKEIFQTGAQTLFRSHRDGILDGEQKRDFIYVKDIIAVVEFLLDQKPSSGIYNLGSGTARSFLDLSKALFLTMEKTTKINWMDTPEKYRANYQYFTQANMSKLVSAGYSRGFTSLEKGVGDYVKNFLLKDYLPL